MGRKKKYLTKEEKIIANREYRMKHYWANVEDEKQKARERYKKQKEQDGHYN